MPFAEKQGLPIEKAPEFSDHANAIDPVPALKTLRSLGTSGETTVICSQGDTIAWLLAKLLAPGRQTRARKGSIWALSFFGEDVIAADYYSHPGS
jgi:8-oxo-dGTP diphosphatase